MLISTLLLLLGGAMLAVVSHSQQRRVHSERTLAMTACRNTLERLRSVDAPTLETLNGTGFDVPGINGQARGLTVLPRDADGLPGSIEVVRHRTSATGDLYLVRTSVRWSGATRGGRFVLECLMGPRR